MDRSLPEPLEPVMLDGRPMFCIRNVQTMRPFLMTVVSASDHWMFVSSLGGLTAGRVRPSTCLFPYETDDRLHRAAGDTGPITLIRVPGAAGDVLWEPFEGAFLARSGTRNLYKSPLSDVVVFEEVRPEFGLTFRYRWATNDAHGLVRTSTLVAHEGGTGRVVEILDGVLNVLPAEVDLTTWQRASCLVDAYRRNELDTASGLAIYALEARISDHTEPAEALTANIVWTRGLEGERHLDPAVLDAFRRGSPFAETPLTTGQPGAYLTRARLTLVPGEARQWHLVADVGLAHAAITAVLADLATEADWDRRLSRAIDAGTERLEAIVARADGLQCSADDTITAHHQLNVLFNNMRGGVFTDGEFISRDDLLAFIEVRHRPTLGRHGPALAATAERWRRADLLDWIEDRRDTDLLRLGLEYLPLTFGRRHGDPSRPWNSFEINVRRPDGRERLDYQGNWRDVFQNWEALLHSHPGFIEHAVARFVNASTVDGFNPYRIFRDGFDWETIDPEDPWSNIGYWGDHQIIYLLQLLEAWRAFQPDGLAGRLTSACYSYADVPYRLAPYDDLVRDPKHTVTFDDARQARVDARVKAMGADGRLVHGADGEVLHVTLAEKLLVPLLCKLSSFIPSGGVWMNTQRPEWNDANNALVGYGVSMVTAFHVRRYVRFLMDVFDWREGQTVAVSSEVADWLGDLALAFQVLPGDPADLPGQRALVDTLGHAFDRYRERAYDHGLSAPRQVPVGEIVALCTAAARHLDVTLRRAQRPDGLFHSYGLLDLSGGGAQVNFLGEMLEGQVAAVGSGTLETPDVLRLVDALYGSAMYRPDQRSFMLYPNVPRPAFLARNVVPPAAVAREPLLAALVEARDTTVIVRAADGTFRFAHTLSGPSDLKRALAALAKDARYAALVATSAEPVSALYADVFNHRAFTGRSGTMYKYEGLGCIYWHMVSKLLVAVAEVALAARERGESVRELVVAWHRLRTGLGVMKTPHEFGAFPIDPYSHTPAHLGAQQPGMTGQAKEGVLLRLGELGVTVRHGRLGFDPFLLRPSERLTKPGRFEYRDVDGARRECPLSPGSLAFTFCQVPVIYRIASGAPEIHVVGRDGAIRAVPGQRLDRETSAAIFERRGSVSRLEVFCPEHAL